MKSKFNAILIAVVIIVIIGIALLGGLLGAGNNGFSQTYNFNVNSVTLINTIKLLKTTNPIFNPPSSIYDPDSLDKSTNHFNGEIYSKEAGESFAFYIEDNSSNATLYLVSINNGLDYKEWKTINHDLNRKDNLNAKKIFEQDILTKLNLKYESGGNNMFIFWK